MAWRETLAELVAGRARALVHLLRFALVFGLTIAAWSWLGEAYAAFFRDSFTWLAGAVGDTVFVRLDAVPPAERTSPYADVVVLLANADHLDRAQVAVASFQVSSRYTGWLDLTFLMSLLLVTPMPWRRRAWVLPVGLVLGELFVLARLALGVLYTLDAHPPLGVVQLDGIVGTLVRGTYESFVRDNLEAGLLFGLLVWAALGVPREAWRRLMEPEPESGQDREASGGS